MGLVETWLNGIGLHYAMPNFEAAGIVTPQALAELDASYFEALGVQDPEDRRKLFFLVQRIKLAVKNETKESGKATVTTEQEVDAVLARSMRTAPSSKKDPQHSSSISPTFRANHSKNSSRNTHPEARRKPVSSKSPKYYEETMSDNEGDEDASEEFDDAVEEETDSEGDNTDSEWEEEDIGNTSTGGDSADDEATSNATSTVGGGVRTRRSSSRVPATTTQSKKITTNKPPNTSLIRPSFQRAQSEKSFSRQPNATKSSRTALSESVSSDASTSSTGRRLSGLVAPKPRRENMRKSKSMRLGKPLSSIPSEKTAPMSPLVDLIASHTDSHSRRSGESVDSFSKFMESLSDGDEHTKSPANGDLRLCKSDDVRFNSSRRRSVSQGRPRSSITGRLNVASSTAQKGSISYHGTKIDNSFKTQINQLREQNENKYGNCPRDESDQDEEMRIRVVVRKRPMSKNEIKASGDVDIIHPFDCGGHGKVLMYQPKTRVDLTKEIETVPFAFDNVFGEESTNVDIYERCVRNLIPCLFEGQWISIFGYGQTASGKTFTMMGSNMTGKNEGTESYDPKNFGLYYMATLDIFEALKMDDFQNYHVGVSFFEIYGGKLYDLLGGRNHIKCLEDSSGKVCFPGLSEHFVGSADDLIEMIETGSKNRSTGTTSRNADSSRSHAVLQLHIRDSSDEDAEFSRMTLIDLAGSERGADTTNSSRATRLEGAEINTSLLALKEVIRALAVGNGMTHVPFRGSRLTQVLKDSFVGINCRSVMIACISPNIGNCDQTLNTLRYADRVKERNPENGELSSSVQASASQPYSISSPRKSTESTAKILSERSTSNVSVHSETSVVLDEILGSPLQTGAQDSLTVRMRPTNQLPPHMKAANDLIRYHKDVMGNMLEMVKDEMTLVNATDSDRDGLDEYIALLAELQGKQLDFFSELRNKIRNYKSVRTLSTDVNRLLEGDSICEDLRE